MSCDNFRPLLTGYGDGELSAEEQRRVAAHVAQCAACAAELAELERLKEDLAMLAFKEPTDAELDRYWGGVYNRLERGLGWALFSAGAILVLCYGAFELIKDFVANPTISVILRVGVAALVVGLVLLFVSLLRERLALVKADRYSREIKR
jgi:predicted anti-sigma-YlaC factor YlaD